MTKIDNSSKMEIEIQNFKGIRNAKYSIKNNCTTLISGKSGVGKSSILEAISYVICGGNSKNFVNIGSNGKVCVKLTVPIVKNFYERSEHGRSEHERSEHEQNQSGDESDQMIITRTNKPKKIEVFFKNSDKTYEDEHAQSYIDEYFTVFFKEIGYIRQKGASSFLQKTSTEKMDFLSFWITNDRKINITKDKLYRCYRCL